MHIPTILSVLAVGLAAISPVSALSVPVTEAQPIPRLHAMLPGSFTALPAADSLDVALTRELRRRVSKRNVTA